MSDFFSRGLTNYSDEGMVLVSKGELTMTNATLFALREIAQPMTNPEPIPSRYRAKQWDSKCGFDVTAGGHTYEVWEHGAVTRIVDDQASPCGYRGVSYQKSGMRVQSATDAAKAVNVCIRRGHWTPCE
jgi:hypothetical protein